MTKKTMRNAAHGDTNYNTRFQVPEHSDNVKRHQVLAEEQGMKLPALVRKLLEKEHKRWEKKKEAK